MYLGYYCRVEEMEEGDFQRLLGKLDPVRQEKTISRRRREDRLLSLAAGLLVRRCLDGLGIGEAPVYDRQGRPLLPGQADVFLSVTHSYPYAAALVSRSPCGIDLERRRPIDAVVRRWYLPREQALCRDDPALAMDLWCRKECMIKCFGLGSWETLDTGSLPEGYAFTEVPLPGFSFQLLTRGGEGRMEEVSFL